MSDDDARYWGKYKAFVRDLADPEKRGRIRVHCPAVMGTKDDKSTWLDWALPCFSSSLFDLPPDKSGVWVEFENGQPGFPIWAGRWLAGKDSDSSEVPQKAKDEYPDNRVFFTEGGHCIEISDKSNNKHIKFTHSNGTTSIELNKDGKVTVDGVQIVFKGGSTPVAKEGSSTTGHSHTLIGTAGPYPIVGTAVTTTDTIATGAGSPNVKVP